MEIGKLEDLANLFKLARDHGVSEFLSSTIASLAGAFFAFKFASATEKRKSYIAETQAVNYAFSVVYSYFNSAHNTKKQLLLPKLAELESVTRELEERQVNKAIIGSISETSVINFKQTFLEMQPVEFLAGTAAKAISSLQYITGRPTIYAVAKLKP